MTTTHTHGDDDDDRVLAEMRRLNALDPDVPNRTKVVRLIVCTDPLIWKDATKMRDLAMQRHATRVDIFVVRRPDPETLIEQWVPMSWLGGALVEHAEGHHKHRETVLILMIQDREQVQWECDVPFRISKIEHIAQHHTFTSIGKGTAHPFRESLVMKEEGGPGKPLISGPPDMKVYKHNRLFKLSFELDLPGLGWTPIDPDMHCDWQ